MKKLKIHFLNTIWSDSILLEYNNHFAFIDTASSFYYPMIKKHLEDYNIKEIDFILLTHFHSDHYGNIINIIKDFKVNKIYLKHYYGIDSMTNNEYITKELNTFNSIIGYIKDSNVEIIYLDKFKKDSMIINLDDLELDLYNIRNKPYEIYNDQTSIYYHQKCFHENFNSVVTFIKINNYNIFLGADITCVKIDNRKLNFLAIQTIKKIYKKYNIDHIDIYKLPHHGGGGTNTDILCNLVKPKYAIITNTKKWLDNWNTVNNLKNSSDDAIILPTDFQKYIFTIVEEISYQIIKEDSLFITLNKN